MCRFGSLVGQLAAKAGDFSISFLKLPGEVVVSFLGYLGTRKLILAG